MNKFVNAEDVKDLLNGLDSLPWEDEVEDMVDRLVVDDVIGVIHAKWMVEEFKNQDKKFITCSNCMSAIDCNKGFVDENEYDYCPYCGAIMDLN